MNLANLDLDGALHGIDAALELLRIVAVQATSLLDDLAAEGVRTTDLWHDALTEAEAAADRDWSRHHRLHRVGRRLRPTFGTPAGNPKLVL